MNKHPEYQYLELLEDIMAHGSIKKDHNTGIELKSVFGRQIRFDLSQGFPILTTKKVYWKGVLYELFWFLHGNSNIKYLVDHGVHIWDDYPYKIYQKTHSDLSKEEFIDKILKDEAFAKQWGELPYIYGQLWRRWPANDRTIDQIKWAIDTLISHPDRKHVVISVWNPEHLYEMAKPGEALMFPLCHILMHFNVRDGKLSCLLYQRSADMFLGVPFNIASYALLTMIIAKVCGYEPGEFVHTFGDAHIYSNHYEQVKEQVSRKPYPFPKLAINSKEKDVDLINPEDVVLENYVTHPPIKGELTVAGGFDEKDRKKVY